MTYKTTASENPQDKNQGISFWGWPLAVALAIFLADQATKLAVVSAWEAGHLLPVIENCFNLVHYRNTGAAWGIFSNHTWILGIISLGALLLVVFFFKSQNRGSKWLALGFALLAGGIAGNMVDRLFRGSVVDFLDFYVGTSHWPAFNVADSAICISLGMLVIVSYLAEHPREPKDK